MLVDDFGKGKSRSSFGKDEVKINIAWLIKIVAVINHLSEVRTIVVVWNKR